jgi:hypothetical protein
MHRVMIPRIEDCEEDQANRADNGEEYGACAEDFLAFAIVLS